MPSQLSEKTGYLREVTELDLNDYTPGTMIYLDMDGEKEKIYLTTIIPGHAHDDQVYRGIAVSGQFKPMKITAPQNVHITRILETGEKLYMGNATAVQVIGNITRIQVWTAHNGTDGS